MMHTCTHKHRQPAPSIKPLKNLHCPTPFLICFPRLLSSVYVAAILKSQAPVQTIQLAVNILKDMLQYSSQLPELAREVGLNSILGILTSLLGLKTEVRGQYVIKRKI